jgi:hypothetical protein
LANDSAATSEKPMTSKASDQSDSGIWSAFTGLPSAAANASATWLEL